MESIGEEEHKKEQMNIVIVGHVDHGKSTVIGRLLADTNTLPEGKLEQIQTYCKNNAKEFEYAFLLDAFKDEQSQGITIDSARCFFKTKKRDYIIIDAPGHIEFLKNMISGAARAEAALLVIDAAEGIKENSKRHAYMLSMLGIQQVIVVVNKMDLIKYDEKTFNTIKEEFTIFAKKINLPLKAFIPVSAREGDNIFEKTKKLEWFTGNSVLDSLDSFEKEKPIENTPFRMPVQDVYKFSEYADNRRIIAGRVETGTVHIGDQVTFLPSGKTAKIASIEEFPPSTEKSISAGRSTGITLEEQIFSVRGQIMCATQEQFPKVSARFKSSVFWMGHEPLILNKIYKLKLATTEVMCQIESIVSVMDASNLSQSHEQIINRHDVAEVVISCREPIAYDLFAECKHTGRFVLVEDYEIVGGGIITESIPDPQSETQQQVYLREKKWYKGYVTFKERSIRYSQIPSTILITGKASIDKKVLAKQVEKTLFDQGRFVYFLGMGNLIRGVDADIDKMQSDEHVRRFGEVSNILVNAGLIVVGSASDLDDHDITQLITIIGKDFFKVIYIGADETEHLTNVDLILNEKDMISVNSKKIIEFMAQNNLIFRIEK